MKPIEAVLQKLECVKRRGNSYMARCPAHDDPKGSLSVSEGADARVLLKCFAGCSNGQVVAALGMSLADLFEQVERKARGKVVATYSYTDEEGRLLYQVQRLEPKSFMQRVPDPTGGWEYKVGKVRRVPYRMPQLLKAVKDGQTIYVVEGEKDVWTLSQVGLIATCNAGGAGRWEADWGQYFEGAARVVLIPDKDDPGRSHMKQVARSLMGKVKSLVWFDLPYCVPEKGDVTDLFKTYAQGADKAEMLRIDVHNHGRRIGGSAAVPEPLRAAIRRKAVSLLAMLDDPTCDRAPITALVWGMKRELSI